MIAPTQPLDGGGVRIERRDREGYSAVRAIETRAQTTSWNHGERARAALDRLGRLLDSGTPLRNDVPPGHYLDVRV
jgi:hypothetical protein